VRGCFDDVRVSQAWDELDHRQYTIACNSKPACSLCGCKRVRAAHHDDARRGQARRNAEFSVSNDTEKRRLQPRSVPLDATFVDVENADQAVGADADDLELTVLVDVEEIHFDAESRLIVPFHFAELRVQDQA